MSIIDWLRKGNNSLVAAIILIICILFILIVKVIRLEHLVTNSKIPPIELTISGPGDLNDENRKQIESLAKSVFNLK